MEEGKGQERRFISTFSFLYLYCSVLSHQASVQKDNLVLFFNWLVLAIHVQDIDLWL